MRSCSLFIKFDSYFLIFLLSISSFSSRWKLHVDFLNDFDAASRLRIYSAYVLTEIDYNYQISGNVQWIMQLNSMKTISIWKVGEKMNNLIQCQWWAILNPLSPLNFNFHVTFRSQLPWHKINQIMLVHVITLKIDNNNNKNQFA